MTIEELDAWCHRAPRECVAAMEERAQEAMAGWQRHARCSVELADLAAFRAPCDCPACVQHACIAAGHAAAELQIICEVWPAPIDRVLRPGRTRRPV